MVQFLCSNAASSLAQDHFGSTPIDECDKVRAKLALAVENDEENTEAKKALENFGKIHSLLRRASFEHF